MGTLFILLSVAHAAVSIALAKTGGVWAPQSNRDDRISDPASVGASGLPTLAGLRVVFGFPLVAASDLYWDRRRSRSAVDGIGGKRQLCVRARNAHFSYVKSQCQIADPVTIEIACGNGQFSII